MSNTSNKKTNTKNTTTNKKVTNNKKTSKKKYYPKKKTNNKVVIENTFLFENNIEEKVIDKDEDILMLYDEELEDEKEDILMLYDEELEEDKEEVSLEEVIDYYNEEVEKEELEEEQEEIKEVEPEEEIKQNIEENIQVEEKAPSKAFIVTGIILTIGLSIMVVYLIYKAFAVGEIENIRYNEESKFTYTINGISEVGNSNNIEIPISNLESLEISTDYSYKTNTVSDLVFKYYYVVKINVTNIENSDEVYYTKSYKLTDEITKEMIKKNEYSLSTNTDIDINDYIDKTNKVLNKYNNSKGNIEVYLMININDLNSNSYNLSLERNPFIRFTISEEELIPEVYDIKTEERVFNRPKVAINKPLRLIEGVLLAFLTMIILIYTIQLVYDNKKE